jgi:hypothetical protein
MLIRRPLKKFWSINTTNRSTVQTNGFKKLEYDITKRTKPFLNTNTNLLVFRRKVIFQTEIALRPTAEGTAFYFRQLHFKQLKFKE